jgi:hypothetical protein
MSKKDGQPKRRGRPPGPGGPKARNPIGPTDGRAQHPASLPASLPMIPDDDREAPDAAHDGDGDGPPDTGEKVSPGDIPDDRRIRKNGTPVRLVVQKLAAIVEAKAIRKVRLESPEGGDIGENRLYHWRMKAGQPSVPAIVRLANFLDVSLEYLIDDNMPVTDPAPRKWESSTFKVLDAATSLGLDIEDVERYLMVTKLAVTFAVEPERAMKMIATGSVERRDYLDGGSGGGVARPASPGGGPRFHSPTTPTVDERVAQREAAQQAERQRNGGPKPKHTG